MNSRLILTIGCTLALIITVACGGGDNEKTIDIGDGDKVKVGTDLPDDFPDDFPIYDDAELQGVVQGEQDGIRGIVATWTTGDDLDGVLKFYEDAFDGGAWVSVTTGAAGGSTFWAVEHDNGDQVGYVTVSGGDQVTIMATVGDDPNAQSGTTDDDGSDQASDGDDEPSDGDGVSSDLPNEVDLPDGFPSDLVPMPDGLRVTTANSFTANGVETFMVGFFTKDTAKEIGEYYKSELEGQGFTQSLETSDPTGIYAAYSQNPDGTGAIVVISVNDGTVEGYREGVLQVTKS